MQYLVYFEDGGTPKAGLSPAWASMATTSGVSKTGPAIAAISNADGWYAFDIKFGTAPWDVTIEDLVGVIDGGTSLSGGDRYKRVAITKRSLALAKLAHDGEQVKATGVTTIKSHDGTVDEFDIALGSLKLDFDSGGTTAIAVGDTITGQTSGATALVNHVVIDSGTWAGGNADGSLYLASVSKAFTNDELLDVGVTTNLATVDGTLITANNYKFTAAP